ncbi:transcriptional regulator [Clostridia bacterium]|nr:transcriptional regulator [Clostridia bacterium]
MNLAERISNAELEVMKLLWHSDKPLTFTDIRTALQKTTKWDKSTIVTMIRRLAEKGVILTDDREVKYYAPNISEAEYVRSEEQLMLDKLYGGSAKKFVASLVSGGTLKESDIDELKNYFKVGGDSDG